MYSVYHVKIHLPKCSTVNLEVLRGLYFHETLHNYAKFREKLLQYARSLCCLLIYVNHALVVNFNIANMSFKAICRNKILVKISEVTVYISSR